MASKKRVSKFAQFIVDNSKDMSITALADAIGISQPYLSQIISGTKTPSIEVSHKIADYFNVSRLKVYKLLGWIDEDGPESKEFEHIMELARKDPDFLELANLFENLTTPEDKRRVIRLLKSLMEDKK